MATATAWFSATTGLSEIRSSTAYSATICRQSGRLRRQLAALQVRPGRAGVALVEDQVEHVQHRIEPPGALADRGHAERHAAGPDALFGPADPPGHRRLGNQERPGNLGGGQA